MVGLEGGKGWEEGWGVGEWHTARILAERVEKVRILGGEWEKAEEG